MLETVEVKVLWLKVSHLIPLKKNLEYFSFLLKDSFQNTYKIAVHLQFLSLSPLPFILKPIFNKAHFCSRWWGTEKADADSQVRTAPSTEDSHTVCSCS